MKGRNDTGYSKTNKQIKQDKQPTESLKARKAPGEDDINNKAVKLMPQKSKAK